MRQKYTKENLEPIVSGCTSIRQVLIKLGLKETGGNYENIKTRIKLFEIDITHFNGKAWNKGIEWAKSKDISSKLVENSSYTSGLPVSSFKLKKQLLKLGYKEHICEVCGGTEWLNEKIPLELHHVNGNRFDNRIENLQLLCPNCHALTDNYRKRKINGQMVK